MLKRIVDAFLCIYIDNHWLYKQLALADITEGFCRFCEEGKIMIKTITIVLGTFLAVSLMSGVAVSEEAKQVSAVREVTPEYPKSAFQRGHTGWAVVKYTVNEQGRAENLEVVSSEPARVFDRAALRAIAQTRFEVPVEAGQPVSADNQYKKFVFEIDEDLLEDVAMNRRDRR
ncbi:MAG: energy transducer TonB [Pseudohongiellaceae bacterium]